jgi:all-trans-nonaprenyl-diphosphate synthase
MLLKKIIKNQLDKSIKYNKFPLSILMNKNKNKNKNNILMSISQKNFSDFIKDIEFIPLEDFNPSAEITKHYKKYIEINVEKSELKKEYEKKLNYIKEKSGSSNTNKISLSNAYSFLSNVNEFNRELKKIRNFIIKEIAEADEGKLKELSEYNFEKMGKMIRPILIILFSKYIHESIFAIKNNMNNVNRNNNNNYSIDTYNNLSKYFLENKIKNEKDLDLIFNNVNDDFFNSKKYKEIVKPFAACIETIHNASLLHDDIIDNSNERRNRKTAHNIYGIRETVFSANFIISKSANKINDLNYPHLSQIFSSIILKLTEGECQQSLRINNFENIDECFNIYMHKTYYKTASLLALSLRGIAIIYDLNIEYQRKLFNLGLHLGIVFQLVDDVLDVSESEKIQKPALKDLNEGVINSHFLYEIIFRKEMKDMVSRKFKGDNDIQKTLDILKLGLGIIKTECLSLDHLIDSVDIITDEFFVNNKTKDDIFRSFFFIINREY